MWAEVAPTLEFISLELGDIVYESGAVKQYVYFPTDSNVSLLFELANGQSAERQVCECYEVVQRETDRLLQSDVDWANRTHCFRFR